jgi:hypothetical protein
MMSNIISVGFGALGEKPNIVFSLITKLLILIVAVSFMGEHRLRLEARGTWLSDCKIADGQLDDCTLAWDRSGTLRDIYQAAVKGR